MKADTQIHVRRLSPSVLALLRGNRFLEREADGFVLRFVYDGRCPDTDIKSVVASANVEGVTRIDLWHPAGGKAPAVDVDSPVPLRAVPVDWLDAGTD